ncbi:MAG: glycosyltransferase family 2 protein [Candidatus Omnitrophica bacterium]|nr:glycosyltransferase family 2 protein [Candidatus Omnitrophota bacterium]
MSRIALSAALITKNEENNILPCLETLSWADEIIVADSGSTDRTVMLARAQGAKVIESSFVDFAAQKNLALQNAAGDWVFFIDADERVTPELQEQILSIVRADRREAVYAVRRKTYLFGRLFSYTGTQDDYPIRLFPRTLAKFKQPVHEYVETALPVLRIHAPLMHHSTANLKQYFSKLDRYLELEMRAMELNQRKAAFWEIFVRPPAKFFKLYLLKQGFRDAWEGFLFSVLSGYYDFCKYSMFYRRQNKIKRDLV